MFFLCRGIRGIIEDKKGMIKYVMFWTSFLLSTQIGEEMLISYFNPDDFS